MIGDKLLHQLRTNRDAKCWVLGGLQGDEPPAIPVM